MSRVPLVKDFKQSTSYRAELSWDTELDITDENLAEFETPTQDLPLRGAWSAHLYRKEGNFIIAIRHGIDGPPAAAGDAVTIRLSLEWVDSRGTTHLVETSQYGPAPLPEQDSKNHEIYGGVALIVRGSRLTVVAAGSAGRYDPKTHRSYRFVAILEQGIDEVSAPALGKQAETLAERTNGPSLLRIRRVKASPVEAREDSKAVEVEVAAVDEQAKDYPDSDDEADTFLFSKKPPKLEQSSEADEVFYRQITINQTAFSTYHAILVYLQTAFIHFTPLSSSFPSADPISSRNDFLAKSLTDKPALPLPVSPKSGYRLAHLLLLQLEDLQKRSLDALRSSLSVSNAAVELFFPTSIAYDELRKVILEFVKENWKEVQKSEGWKEKKAAVKAREASLEEAAVLAEVLRAVAES